MGRLPVEVHCCGFIGPKAAMADSFDAAAAVL
jgi:hypothetical protein